MSEPVVYIQPKNSLFTEKKKIDIINKINTRIRGLPQIEISPQILKMDMEVLLFACQLAEHLVENDKNDKKHKLDKKQIVLSAMELAFTRIMPDEKLVLEKNIEFLHDNKRIKKVGTWSMISASICEWITRRVL
jgi:hypothetical protein